MLRLLGLFVVVVGASTAIWVGLSVLVGGPLIWGWWALMALIGLIGYVQDVGTQFERDSGLTKRDNLDTYYMLFRGLPWLLFRWGGLIRLAGLVGILLLAGWQAALLSLLGLFLLSFALRPVSRKHAVTMYKQVMEQSE